MLTVPLQKGKPLEYVTKLHLIVIDLVGFYGISTIVDYLISNPVFTYILGTYDLVGFYGNHCQGRPEGSLFNSYNNKV